MHSLLARQIRKYLPTNLASKKDIQSFLDAINSSYKNTDDKLDMIQRSTVYSSMELSASNEGLRQEIENQKKILMKISKAVALIDHNANTNSVVYDEDLDSLNLASYIEEQTNRLLELTSEKNTLNKDLERQNESLSNYAHIVSHDLKSPIQNIHTLMSWLEEQEQDNFSETSRQNCSLIFKNLTKMDNLIDGILRHSSLGLQEEEKVNISIEELIEEIKGLLVIPKNINIFYDKKLPILYAEKYKLHKLFKNLITNAIFAIGEDKKGEIKINVREGKMFWKFSVKDNGKGIPEQYHKTIFDMFRKLENNANSIGVGLALVKKIVEMYQGKIWVESEEKKGSTFFFTLKKNGL
ncbi:MAG: ATP-binding protein [Cellulophaga sp.]